MNENGNMNITADNGKQGKLNCGPTSTSTIPSSA